MCERGQRAKGGEAGGRDGVGWGGGGGPGKGGGRPHTASTSLFASFRNTRRFRDKKLCCRSVCRTRAICNSDRSLGLDSSHGLHDDGKS